MMSSIESRIIQLGGLGPRAIAEASATVLELCERSAALQARMRGEDFGSLLSWMDQQGISLLPMPPEALSSAEGFEYHGEYRFDIFLWTIEEQPSDLELRITLLVEGDSFTALVDGLLWS